MSAGIELYNDVLNQLGSPALYSDIFANRPTFGYTGRLFISTDTLEIYRDTGTAWQLLSSGGGGVNIYNSNGSLTAARTMTMAGFSLTFSGGASAATLNLNANNNVNREIKYQTGGVDRWQWLVSGNETGSNSGSDLSLRAYDDVGTYINPALTIRRGTSKFEMYTNDALTSGGSVGYVGYYMSGQATYVGALSITGNPQGSIYNIFTFTNNGSPTFAASNVVSSLSNVTRISGGNGTVTLTQAAGSVRAMSNVASLTQYNLINNVTVTHYAGINALGVDDIAATGGILTLTNAYQLLINSLDEYGEIGVGTLVITNRWGIYQTAALDSNYLNGNTLIGSTTSTGEKLQVTGTARVTQSAYFATASGSVGIGTTSPSSKLHVIASTNQILILDSNDANGGRLEIRKSNTIYSYLGDGRNIFGAGYDNSTAISTNGANFMSFGTNLSERMRITSGGNLLIGTTTDSGQKLYLNGDFRNDGDILIRGAYNPYAAANRGVLQLNGTNGNLVVFSNNTTVHGYINCSSTLYEILATGTQDFDFYQNAALTFKLTSNSNFGIRQNTFGTSATRTLAISSGTAPGSSPVDCFQLYSADITAGNAAAHFRTENGAIVKIYQETTAVGSATIASPGAGNTVKTDDTFDGYTLQQVVKALRNQGILA